MVPSNTQLQSIIVFIAVRGTICIQASTNCAATPSKWLQASYNLMIVRGKRAQINTAVISHSVDDRVWLCIIRFERIWQHNSFALQIYPSTWRPTTTDAGELKSSGKLGPSCTRLLFLLLPASSTVPKTLSFSSSETESSDLKML